MLDGTVQIQNQSGSLNPNYFGMNLLYFLSNFYYFVIMRIVKLGETLRDVWQV